MERRGTKVEARQSTVGKVKMQGEEVVKVEDDAWFIDGGNS